MAESAKRVAVLDPDGNFGTVEEADAEAVTRAGGRLLTKQEVAAREAQEAYRAAPLSQKVAGAVAAPFETGVLAMTPGLAPVAAAGGALAGALRSQGGVVAPEQEAFDQGVDAAMTGGLNKAAVHEAVRRIGGDKAAKAYADTLRRAGQGFEDYKTAGSVAGLAADLINPGGIGELVERGAAKAMSGLAARGVAGRALATAGELAARGAVEGALLGGAQQLSEDMLGDREVAADKVFASMGTGALYGAAGGALLGGAGSLAKSGASAAGRGVARLMERSAGDGLQGGVKNWLKGASNELAFDALGATKVQARNALKNVASDQREAAKAVGEYMNRIALKPLAGESGALGSAAKAGMGGRADQLLDAIDNDVATRLKPQFDEVLNIAPARVSLDELVGHAKDIHGDMVKDPTRIAAAQGFLDRVVTELSAFENAGKIAAGSLDAKDAFFARSAMQRKVYEIARSTSDGAEAYKEFLRRMDSTTLREMSDAAERAGTPGLLGKIREAKREYQLAMAAQELAEGGAERILGNNIIGIREGIGMAAGFAATGDPTVAIATGIGGKMLRERGAAAGAAFLGRLADMDALSKLVARVDQQITRASRGVLEPPKSVPKLTGYREPAKLSAERMATQVREAQANPEAFVARIQRVTEGLQATAPGLAGGLTRRMTDAVAFLASKLPPQPEPDPFDPRPQVRMTPTQAMEFSRYASYVERPDRFFEEAERGQITFEGVEVAKALMPDAFAEMQARTAEGLAELLARGVRVPIRQRERLGLLMDFPAVPSQRPAHIAFLQRNVVGSEQASKAPKPGNRPIQTRPQQTTYDRLEET